MSSYEYNQLLKFLYFEGYADSYEEAEYILEDLSDEEFEDLNEASKSWSVTKIRKFNKEIERQKEQRKKTPNSSLRPGDQAALARMLAKRQSPTRSAREVEPATQEQPRQRTTNLANVKIGEDFDIISEFLFVEGYADTIENAELMVEGISKEWVEEILEKFNPSDYKEYDQKNHRDERNPSAEWDAQEKDYQDSKGDIRDKHNQARGVKIKKGKK